MNHSPTMSPDEMKTVEEEAREELKDLQPLFWIYARPRTAINWGYQIYLHDLKAKQKHNGQKSIIVAGTEEVVAMYRELLDKYGKCERARAYFVECLRVAIDYSRSLERARQHRNESKRRADRWKRLQERNELNTTTRNGLLRMGVKLLIVAVTTYAAVKLFSPFLSLVGVDPSVLEHYANRPGTSEWGAVFGAGLAAIVSIWREIGHIRSIERELLLQYHLSRQEAEHKYGLDRQRAMDSAYFDIAEVHERIMGEPAPGADEFLAGVRALSQPDIDEAARDIRRLTARLTSTPWKKIVRFFRRSQPVTKTMAP